MIDGLVRQVYASACPQRHFRVALLCLYRCLAATAIGIALPCVTGEHELQQPGSIKLQSR